MSRKPKLGAVYFSFEGLIACLGVRMWSREHGNVGRNPAFSAVPAFSVCISALRHELPSLTSTPQPHTKNMSHLGLIKHAKLEVEFVRAFMAVLAVWCKPGLGGIADVNYDKQSGSGLPSTAIFVRLALFWPDSECSFALLKSSMNLVQGQCRCVCVCCHDVMGLSGLSLGSRRGPPSCIKHTIAHFRVLQGTCTFEMWTSADSGSFLQSSHWQH